MGYLEVKIKLFAHLGAPPLSASVSGDVLTLNGAEFDFTPLKSGQRIPVTAIDSDWFVGPYVERIGKTIHLTLRLPVVEGSPEEYRNPPQPIILDARSGKVNLPDTSPPAPPPEPELPYETESPDSED